MQILGTLFGTEARVKLMRLFLFNPESNFDLEDICERSKVTLKEAKIEVQVLLKSGLIKRKVFWKEKKEGLKKKIDGFCVDTEFSHMEPLKRLLISDILSNKDNLISEIGRGGKLKLLAVAGIFTEDPDSRIDMLIVGNNFNKVILNNSIKKLEAELGKELVYAYFETADFKYRMTMYDKLVRDIFDFPHKIILDRLSIAETYPQQAFIVTSKKVL